MTAAQVIFVAAFAALAGFLVLKKRELSGKGPTPLRRLSARTDPFLLAAAAGLRQVWRLFRGLFGRRQIAAVFQLLFLVIGALTAGLKEVCRRFLGRARDYIRRKKIISGRGPASVFLKDILEHKNRLTEKQ